MITINVAKDFTRYPAGRKKTAGPTSGEEFREKFLVPHIKNRDRIKIELDGTIGYGSSFLEEAFGGLVRAGLTSQEIQSRIEMRSSDKSLIEEIITYINDQSQNSNPHK